MDWVSKDCLVGGVVFDFLEFGCLMILIELGSVEEREGCVCYWVTHGSFWEGDCVLP